MKRTSLSLPDDLAVALDREARRTGTTVSAVARDAISSHLGLSGSTTRTLGFAAVGRSDSHTTARGLEDLLDKERHADRDR